MLLYAAVSSSYISSSTPYCKQKSRGRLYAWLSSSIRRAFKRKSKYEDALGVPIDEGGGHAEHFIGDPGQFRHSLSLGAFAAVLVQLVYD